MNKAKNTQAKSKWAAFAHADGTFDFEALSAAQKEAFYQECEAIGDEVASPLTQVQRRLHARAARGRPRKGNGAKIVSLSIEKELLRRADQLAMAQGVSRSELFSRGLRAVLASVRDRSCDCFPAPRGRHF